MYDTANKCIIESLNLEGKSRNNTESPDILMYCQLVILEYSSGAHHGIEILSDCGDLIV